MAAHHDNTQQFLHDPAKDEELAMLLLSYDEETASLELNNRTLGLIRKAPSPFRILAAVGDARIGKSTFLNGLTSLCTEHVTGECRYFSTFKVGHHQNPCTKGVWVKLLPLGKGTLMILDVEGIYLGDDRITTQLSLFTTLLASEIMLFGHKVLTNNAIRFLHNIAKLKEVYFEHIAEAQIAHICVALQDPFETPDLRDIVAAGLTRRGQNEDKLDDHREQIGAYIKYEDIKVLMVPLVGKRDRENVEWPVQDEEYREALEIVKGRLSDIVIRTSLHGGPMDGSAIVDAITQLVSTIKSDQWDVWTAYQVDFEERLSIQAFDKYIKPLLQKKNLSELETEIPEALKQFKEKCKLDKHLQEAERSLREHKTSLTLEKELERSQRSLALYEENITPLLEKDMPYEELEKMIPQVLQKMRAEDVLPVHADCAESLLKSRLEILQIKEQQQQAAITKEAYNTHIEPLLRKDISSRDLENAIKGALQNFTDQCPNKTVRDQAEHSLHEHLQQVRMQEKCPPELYNEIVRPLLDLNRKDLENAIPIAMKKVEESCTDGTQVQETRLILEHRLNHLEGQESRVKQELVASIVPMIKNAGSSTELEAAIEAIETSTIGQDEELLEIKQLLMPHIEALRKKETDEDCHKTQEAYTEYIIPLLNVNLSSKEVADRMEEAIKSYSEICKDEKQVEDIKVKLQSHVEHLQWQETSRRNHIKHEAYNQWIAPLYESGGSSEEVNRGIPKAILEYYKVCSDDKDRIIVHTDLQTFVDTLRQKENTEGNRKIQRAEKIIQEAEKKEQQADEKVQLAEEKIEEAKRERKEADRKIQEANAKEEKKLEKKKGWGAMLMGGWVSLPLICVLVCYIIFAKQQTCKWIIDFFSKEELCQKNNIIKGNQ